MTENLGIDETAEVVDFVAVLGNAIDGALLDGKFNWMDFGQFFALVPRMAPAINGIDKVPRELSDLSVAERAILAERLAVTLKLQNPVTEVLSEKAFDLALHLAEFVSEIRKAKQTQIQL